MAERATGPFAAYLDELRARLGDLTPDERDEIARELLTHLADAAAGRGATPDDPGVQAAIIGDLGPSKRLARALLLAHRPEEWHLAIGNPWRFWALWVVASVVGWAAAHPVYAPLSVAIGGACAALLQLFVLRRGIARPGWWRGWALAAVAPWLACAALFGTLPWERMDEPAWEGAFFYALVTTSILLGALQWFALRRYVAAAGLWIGVPLVGLCLGWLLTALVNNIVVDAFRPWLTANRWYDEMFFLLGLLFGLIYGALSGGVLVLLARGRARGLAPRLA